MFITAGLMLVFQSAALAAAWIFAATTVTSLLLGAIWIQLTLITRALEASTRLIKMRRSHRQSKAYWKGLIARESPAMQRDLKLNLTVLTRLSAQLNISTRKLLLLLKAMEEIN